MVNQVSRPESHEKRRVPRGLLNATTALLLGAGAIASCSSEEVPAAYVPYESVEQGSDAVGALLSLAGEGEQEDEQTSEQLEAASRGLVEAARIDLGNKVVGLIDDKVAMNEDFDTGSMSYYTDSEEVLLKKRMIPSDGEFARIEYEIVKNSKYGARDRVVAQVDADGTVGSVILPGLNAYILRPVNGLSEDDPVIEDSIFAFRSIEDDDLADDPMQSVKIIESNIASGAELLDEIGQIISESTDEEQSELRRQYVQTRNDIREDEQARTRQSTVDAVLEEGADPKDELGEYNRWQKDERDKAERDLVDAIPGLVESGKFEQADQISDAIDDEGDVTREVAELALASAVETETNRLVNEGNAIAAQQLAKDYERSDMDTISKLANSARDAIQAAIERILKTVGL